MSALRAVLARLADPPDTSQLSRCSHEEMARAVTAVRALLTRRRLKLMSRPSHGRSLERVLGALRRLQNPALAGYIERGRIVLSEPFQAVCSVTPLASEATAQRLLADMLGRYPPKTLVSALRPFGDAALRAARDGGVRIRVVPPGRKLAQCSADVAAIVPDIDSWLAPPAGLFVLSERLVLLRSRALRMTAAHEFAHALDAVAAKRRGSYYSYENDEIRKLFATGSGFVNEYAASGLDEYFAEAMRAYVEVNDERSQWLPLTRHDLLRRDPALFAHLELFFQRIGQC